jgi:ABC-type Mn2+/Zn2+ transport system ATPase subunit
LREKFPKLSIIIVSHNINIVYKNSSKIICLHWNGKFCYGTPEEISKDKDFLDIFWNYLAPLKHNHKN